MKIIIILYLLCDFAFAGDDALVFKIGEKISSEKRAQLFRHFSYESTEASINFAGGIDSNDGIEKSYKLVRHFVINKKDDSHLFLMTSEDGVLVGYFYMENLQEKNRGRFDKNKINWIEAGYIAFDFKTKKRLETMPESGGHDKLPER